MQNQFPVTTYQTTYRNVEGLQLHFGRQLDKLATEGFIEFTPEETAMTGNTTYNAALHGNGAIAQGKGAQATGAGGVSIGGNNSGTINTGTQINTGGGAYLAGNVHAGGDFIGRDRITHGIAASDLEPLFAGLLAAIAQHAPPDRQAPAVQQVQELKAEASKGGQANDGRLARIVDGLTEMVPGAVGAVLKLFASPILDGIAGPATKYVLDKIRGD